MSLPPDLDVRPAGPGDEPTLNDLIAACDESYRDWTPDGWEPPPAGEALQRWGGRMTDGTFWTRAAFEPDGRAVCLVAFTQAVVALPDGTRTLEPIPGRAHVSAVFTHPDRWREGLARELLARAEAAMREQGFTEVQLWTPERAPARRFYESSGWRADGRTVYMAELDLPLVAYRKTL